MVLDSISSPHRRPNPFSSSFKKQFLTKEELGGNGTCSGLSGTQQALCRLEQAKSSMAKGKLKFH